MCAKTETICMFLFYCKFHDKQQALNAIYNKKEVGLLEEILDSPTGEGKKT